MDNKFVQVLKSRKFWAALIGLCVAFFGSRAGISQEALLSSTVVVVGYIIGAALD